MGAVDANRSHRGSRCGTRCFNADLGGRADGDGGTAVPPPPQSADELVDVAASALARPYVPCAASLHASDRLGIEGLEKEVDTGDAVGRGDDDESNSGDECATN